MAAYPDETGARREAMDRAELREAYERGRRDARAARKRHPVLMTFTVVAALVGVVLMALAAVNGSFGGAGRVVDQNLSVAADRAEPVVRDAASDASRAIGEATTSPDTLPTTPSDRTEATDRPG
jgi:hypothetical protein